MAQLRETARRNMGLAPRASSGALPPAGARIPRASAGMSSPPQGAIHASAHHPSSSLSGNYVPRASTGGPVSNVRAPTNLAARGSNASMSSTSLRNLLQVGSHVCARVFKTCRYPQPKCVEKEVHTPQIS